MKRVIHFLLSIIVVVWSITDGAVIALAVDDKEQNALTDWYYSEMNSWDELMVLSIGRIPTDENPLFPNSSIPDNICLRGEKCSNWGSVGSGESCAHQYGEYLFRQAACTTGAGVSPGIFGGYDVDDLSRAIVSDCMYRISSDAAYSQTYLDRFLSLATSGDYDSMAQDLMSNHGITGAGDWLGDVKYCKEMVFNAEQKVEVLGTKEINGTSANDRSLKSKIVTALKTAHSNIALNTPKALYRAAGYGSNAAPNYWSTIKSKIKSRETNAIYVKSGLAVDKGTTKNFFSSLYDMSQNAKFLLFDKEQIRYTKKFEITVSGASDEFDLLGWVASTVSKEDVQLAKESMGTICEECKRSGNGLYKHLIDASGNPDDTSFYMCMLRNLKLARMNGLDENDLCAAMVAKNYPFSSMYAQVHSGITSEDGGTLEWVYGDGKGTLNGLIDVTRELIKHRMNDDIEVTWSIGEISTASEIMFKCASDDIELFSGTQEFGGLVTELYKSSYGLSYGAMKEIKSLVTINEGMEDTLRATNPSTLKYSSTDGGLNTSASKDDYEKQLMKVWHNPSITPIPTRIADSAVLAVVTAANKADISGCTICKDLRDGIGEKVSISEYVALEQYLRHLLSHLTRNEAWVGINESDFDVLIYYYFDVFKSEMPGFGEDWDTISGYTNGTEQEAVKFKETLLRFSKSLGVLLGDNGSLFQSVIGSAQDQILSHNITFAKYREFILECIKQLKGRLLNKGDYTPLGKLLNAMSSLLQSKKIQESAPNVISGIEKINNKGNLNIWSSKVRYHHLFSDMEMVSTRKALYDMVMAECEKNRCGSCDTILKECDDLAASGDVGLVKGLAKLLQHFATHNGTQIGGGGGSSGLPDYDDDDKYDGVDDDPRKGGQYRPDVEVTLGGKTIIQTPMGTTNTELNEFLQKQHVVSIMNRLFQSVLYTVGELLLLMAFAYTTLYVLARTFNFFPRKLLKWLSFGKLSAFEMPIHEFALRMVLLVFASCTILLGYAYEMIVWVIVKILMLLNLVA